MATPSTDHEFLLKLQFPAVTRSKQKTNEFYGVLRSVENEPILVSFNVPNYPSTSDITFELGIELTEDILNSLKAISTDVNFYEFLKMIHTIILKMPRKLRFNASCVAQFWDEFRLVRSLNPLDTFLFNEKNETVTLQHTDEFGAEKVMTIKVDFYNYSPMYKVIEHNFVALDDVRLRQKQISLEYIYKVFLDLINNLIPYHSTLNKIDNLCWVTSPLEPSFETDFRIITVAEDNVRLKLTFKPWAMSDLPDFKFYGPSEIVEKYRELFSRNLINYDPDKDIIQNILELLDIPFLPIKPEETIQETKEVILYDSNKECCICFNHYLDQEVPDIICPNKCCKRQFHASCLHEWLSRFPDYEVIFGLLTGDCPNCEKKISCRVMER